MVVPLYISEISPSEIRGSLLVFEEFSIVFGAVISFWITYGTKEISGHLSWHLPSAIQIIPGLLLGLGAFFFLPYSPRWLAAEGREDEPLSVLSRLRMLPSTDSRVRREWIEIVAESTFQKQVLERRHPELVSKTMLNRLKLEICFLDSLSKARLLATDAYWSRTHALSAICGNQYSDLLLANSFQASSP
tara:strand:+ start:923 stop:1492 length:570 start_codon:yes stop_codon:yes gene_type:complete